jgi:hypothetical protein
LKDARGGVSSIDEAGKRRRPTSADRDPTRPDGFRKDAPFKFPDTTWRAQGGAAVPCCDYQDICHVHPPINPLPPSARPRRYGYIYGSAVAGVTLLPTRAEAANAVIDGNGAIHSYADIVAADKPAVVTITTKMKVRDTSS